MKRKDFALSLLALALGGTASAGHGDSRRGGHSNGRGRSSRNYRSYRRRRSSGRSRSSKTITDSPIKYTGILESNGDKLSISGSKMPIEVDRGMTFLAKKHVGKQVEVTGTKITVDGKSKVRVKFIKPVATTDYSEN